MSTVTEIPPARRHELVVQPLGSQGQVVVKDPRTGSYYNLGEEESFLLARLDGRRSVQAICDEFAVQFRGPLTEAELHEFLTLAQGWGLLEEPAGATPLAPAAGPRPRPSLLAWRHRLFDPDRLFSAWEPRLRFFWTPWFLLISAGCIGTAAVVAWLDRDALAQPLAQNVRWEVLVLGWLTLIAVTTLHEFAHGLTCKHHGGEVHEVGLLVLFFMPGMYCNVSDAWLLPEKSKRISVTLAGGYFELFLWSLAVFTWRLSVAGSLANLLAWGVVSVSGIRVLFNFNPLMKLDGYYLLSDLLEIPNLRQRSWAVWLGHLRWLLWGSVKPAREPKGAFLLGLGAVSWCFSVVLPATIVCGMVRWFVPRGGWIAIGLCAGVAGVVIHTVFQGFFAGELHVMIAKRRRRAAGWVLGLGVLPAILALGRIEHRPGGTFKLRPAARMELRAPVAGFLRAVYRDEGDRVSPGTLVVLLEVPDLDTRTIQKQAELREAQAELRRVEAGARPEEVDEQRRRVERAERWSALARQDLERVRIAHRENLQVLRHKVAQGCAERAHSAGVQRRARTLFLLGYLSTEEYQSEQLKATTSVSQLEQAKAEARASEAEGTREAEAECARRDRELADATAALELLLAGSRPEERDAAHQRAARLQEEVGYLEGLKDRLRIHAGVPGLITTPRLREKVGQYVHEGDLIGEVQTVDALEAEIAVDEQAAAAVRPGQSVELKARARALQTFHGCVDRIAPSAVREEDKTQSTVTIYCRLTGPASDLKPQMTGYARIACGRRPIGELVLERLLGYLRTEFWL